MKQIINPTSNSSIDYFRMKFLLKVLNIKSYQNIKVFEAMLMDLLHK